MTSVAFESDNCAAPSDLVSIRKGSTFLRIMDEGGVVIFRETTLVYSVLMEIRPEQLLQDHTKLRTHDVKEIHAYITGMEGKHERSAVCRGDTYIVLRHFPLSKIDVGVHYASIPMTVASARDRSANYLLLFPLTNRGDLEIDAKEFAIYPENGLVVSPTQKVNRTGQPGWALVLVIDAVLLRSRFKAHHNRVPEGPLTFHPLISDGSKTLLHYCLLIIDAIDRNVVTADGKLSEVLARGLADLLLSTQAHSDAKDPDDKLGSDKPDSLSRVEFHIEEHLAEKITLKDLTDVAECSTRSLQQKFANYYCLSPMHYLERRRLSRARDLLESLQGQISIMEVTRECGFTHPPRFAGKYKERYGETPSQTIRRLRGK